MAIDFSKLRERKGTNFAAVQQSLQKTEQGNFKKDERIWKPTKGKDGKSANIIRFLPISYVDLVGVEEGRIKEEDLTPMAKIYRYEFQGQDGWMFENSLQTFGEPDPIREFDGPNWRRQKETKDEHLKKVLIKRIAKTDYYACILVIKDGTVPENNGKIMIYKFGETIRNRLESAKNPEFEGEVSFDPFDAWEGANMLLNLTYEKKTIDNKEIDAPDFKNVKWGPVGPLGDDAYIEEIWKKQYSIMDFYDRKHFKTYDELKAKLCKVMRLDDNFNPLPARGNTEVKETLDSKISAASETKAPEVTATKAPEATPTAIVDTTTNAAVDDDLASFEALLNG